MDDVRKSPAPEIMELVRECGALLGYSDAHVAMSPKMREHRVEMIAKCAKMLVDTRARLSKTTPNIVKA